MWFLCHWEEDALIPDKGGGLTAGSEKMKMSVDVIKNPGYFNRQFYLKLFVKTWDTVGLKIQLELWFKNKTLEFYT